MPYRIALLAAALVLTGCGQSKPETPAKTRQQRAADTAAKLDKGPATRTHKVDGGEVKVLDVPVPGPVGLMVKKQQCIVWRDAEYRTASISCPHPPEIALGRDGSDTGQADTAPY